MVYVTEEYQDWIECWIFMALFMQTGLDIWIREDLQVGMCLTYFKMQSIG